MNLLPYESLIACNRAVATASGMKIEDYDSYDHMYSLINSGSCCHWALMIYQCHAVVLCSINGDHAFIKYNSKYYDSECLNGVDDYIDLPFFKRYFINEVFQFRLTIPEIRKIFKEYSEKDFINYWSLDSEFNSNKMEKIDILYKASKKEITQFAREMAGKPNNYD